MGRLTPAEVYRHEAERLRALAVAPSFHGMRDAFLEIAARYEVLARQADGLQTAYIANEPIAFRQRAANQGTRPRLAY